MGKCRRRRVAAAAASFMRCIFRSASAAREPFFLFFFPRTEASSSLVGERWWAFAGSLIFYEAWRWRSIFLFLVSRVSSGILFLMGKLSARYFILLMGGLLLRARDSCVSYFVPIILIDIDGFYGFRNFAFVFLRIFVCEFMIYICKIGFQILR